MILYTSDYSKIYKLRYRPQGRDTIRLGIKWAQSSKLKAQSYPQITQITQIFKFKTKKLGGSKAGILFVTDPASLWRATQDRPGFALASYAGQARLRSGELRRTGPASLWRAPDSPGHVDRAGPHKRARTHNLKVQGS
jgi:hypothetical protein